MCCGKSLSLSFGFHTLAVLAFASHQSLAWSPNRRLSSLSAVSDDNSFQGESTRRNILAWWPMSIATSCCLTQNVQPSWADDVELEPALAAVAGDAKKVGPDACLAMLSVPAHVLPPLM